MSADVDQLCEEYFGFVRALLSPDGRLRLVYRRHHLSMAIVEVRRPDGWREFDKMRELILPLGRRRDVYRQNQHLPARYPFAGLTSPNGASIRGEMALNSALDVSGRTEGMQIAWI